MTAASSLGEVVDFNPTEKQPTSGEVSATVLDPGPVVDWSGSSFDLLNGMEMRDHTDSISGDAFDRLFKR